MRYGHYYDKHTDIYKNKYLFIPDSKYNRNHIKLFDYIWDEFHDKHGVVFQPYCKDNSHMLVKYLNGKIDCVLTQYLHPKDSINNPTLQPCPLCGGYPLIERNHGYRIFCTTCGLQSAKLPLFYWAIQMWENRGDISAIYHTKEQTDYRNSQHLDPKENYPDAEHIMTAEEDIHNMTSSQYCWVNTHTVNSTGVSPLLDGKPVDFGEHTDLYEALNLYGYRMSKNTADQLVAKCNIHTGDFVSNSYYYMLDPYRWCKDNPKMQDILTM